MLKHKAFVLIVRADYSSNVAELNKLLDEGWQVSGHDRMATAVGHADRADFVSHEFVLLKKVDGR